MARGDPAALFLHMAIITPRVSTMREATSPLPGTLCSNAMESTHVNTGMDALQASTYGEVGAVDRKKQGEIRSTSST